MGALTDRFGGRKPPSCCFNPPQRQGQALGLYGIGTAGTAISSWTMPALVDGFRQGRAGSSTCSSCSPSRGTCPSC
jgi:hypothetical protein